MAALSRSAPLVQVRLDGVLVAFLQVERVVQSVGGQHLDYAELLAKTEIGLRSNLELYDHPEMGQTCQINIYAAPGSGLPDPDIVHYGVISKIGIVLQDGNESYKYVSRLEPHHFGPPITGTEEFNALLGAWHNTLEPVFNPEIDGRIYPNKAYIDNLFVEPESLRTQAARDENHNGNEAEFWTLGGAVLYLARQMGPDALIEGPLEGQLFDEISQDVAFQKLRNHRIRLGTSIPRALDELLTPYGVGWYVDPRAFPKPRIRLFRRGGYAGLSATAFLLQPRGEELDTAASTLHAARFEMDTSDAFNRVQVYGGLLRMENTFVLTRAWNKEKDTKTQGELDSATLALEPDSTDVRVWRDWVLNEAGDYNDTRPDILTYDLDIEFREIAPQSLLDRHPITQYLAGPWRRRFLPCLTLGDDGKPAGSLGTGVLVEYWDEGDAEWYPIQEYIQRADHEGGVSFQVLADECGIRFTGRIPPFMEFGDDANIRVTATVEADVRLEGFSPTDLAPAPPGSSVNDNPQWLVIDAGDRFKFHKRHGSSRYVDFGLLEVDEVDDEAAIHEFAAGLLDAWDIATVRGEFSLAGLEYGKNYPLGSLIHQIVGRDIGFDGRKFGAKYPQVTRLTYDVRRQECIVTLDTLRAVPRV